MDKPTANNVMTDGGFSIDTPTTGMRLVERLVPIGGGMGERRQILQQRFKVEHNKNGISFEWRDVPLEVE